MGHSSKAGENIFWAMNRNKPGIIKRILNAGERFIARIRGKDAYLAVEQRQAAERLRDMLTGELKRAYGTDVKGEAAVESDGGKKYSIVYLDDGKTYVTASRNVISGNDVNQWRKQITNFFTALLEGNKSISRNRKKPRLKPRQKLFSSHLRTDRHGREFHKHSGIH